MSKFEGFDLVVGNPPYQKGKTGTGNTLYQCFTEKALKEWLNDDGQLLFVHPPGWRKPNTIKSKFYGFYDLMAKKNNVLFLSIHDTKNGKKTFDCGI